MARRWLRALPLLAAPATTSFAANQPSSAVPPSGCPMHNKEPGSSGPPSPLTGGCPVRHKKEGKVYNVYSEEIDPTNMMPQPNQGIAPGQQYPLSTERVDSTIPKGGTESTWSYPSPQMFYNALVRKNKGENVQEEDVSVIVAIHNNMNEKTWKEVMSYEHHCHPGSVDQVKLLKFIGRPDELSPIARIKSWLGYGIPFDRHDWTIDRNGTLVRYVIDYYHDETQTDELPGLHSEGKVQSISLYVRPAVDSPTALLDRIKMGFHCMTGGSNQQTSQDQQPESEEEVKQELAWLKVDELDWRSDLSADEWTLLRNRLTSKCSDKMLRWKEAENEEEYQMAARMVDLCMGALACQEESRRFKAALESNNESVLEKADQELFDCVGAFKAAMAGSRK
eukprot:TRINITY_DN26125_c0_g1_i1.p1 TRINITY_DN26125_c0_g1~~TRINITY_DN26125_c0_g1_i1.p1  ORF type:complete len:394 (-),score=80.01 TRINITY_DN26125_c0_g1_i1:377-1558(-)